MRLQSSHLSALLRKSVLLFVPIVDQLLRLFYIYVILFHGLHSVINAGSYYELIASKDETKRLTDAVPFMRKEFFQCGREESCTHVLRLVNNYVLVYGIDNLERRKQEAHSIYKKVKMPVTSCLDLYHNGMSTNGIYEVLDHSSMPFLVMCDFESEANSVWTLVASFSLRNKSLCSSPFTQSCTRNESSPNWLDYRLGLPRMDHLRSLSSMWRATCSFPKYKSNIYRDYIRAQINDVNFMQYIGTGSCRKVDYINVRGHQGSKITVPFWQHGISPFHIDSSSSKCQFDARRGSTNSEDNFGFYYYFNRAFRCVETNDSTTQYWFGDNV